MTTNDPAEAEQNPIPTNHCSWLNELEAELLSLRDVVLLRELRVVTPIGKHVERGGRRLLNFAGNDYLGLAQHPLLVQASVDAARQFGVGSGASRLVTGHQPIHQQVEERFAALKHAGAALLFPTGYMANLAVLSTLADKSDVILLDKLNHASLIDAAHASGAEVRVYPHLNHDKLEKLLERYQSARRRLIVTDSVFSMDGDVADLPTLCGLAEKYNAITVVDEAHGTGVLGNTGAGLCEMQHVGDKVDIVISTASKAMASLGGIVTARKVVIGTLVNKARSFIYTTGVPPTQAAVILAALELIELEPQRRERLHAIIAEVRTSLADRGYEMRIDLATPIVPLIVNSPEAAISLSNHLEKHGIYAPAIRPPTVAPNACRVRLTLRADLTDEDVTTLLNAMDAWSA